MPRDDWARARTHDIQRTAWMIQRDQEAEDRATAESLKHAYETWNRKIHKSKKSKKKHRNQRAHSGRPSGPQLATVRAGRTSTSTGNRGTGLRGQPWKTANQQPVLSGKDGSNLQERSASPSVSENPVTQTQHPSGHSTATELDQANTQLLAYANEQADAARW